MATLTVNSVPCGAPSSITTPLQGLPWADVTLGAQSVPWSVGDQVQLQVEDGPTYNMTVERVGSSGGFTRARLIGGTGGLSTEVQSRFYHGVTPSQVLRELLGDCGETTGEIELPTAPLPIWVRPAGPAHEALRALLMRYPGYTWRMNPLGQVNVSPERWVGYEPVVSIESEDPAAASFTVQFSPSLRAGQSVTMTREGETFSKRATRVTHQISETYAFPRNQIRLRTIIGTGDGKDSGVSGLEATVQRAVRWVDYLSLYDCEVLRDHGDHTLDLRPSNPMLPEMTRVRLVQPFPGAKLKLKAGGIVLLSFQSGDPARPVALHHGLCELERLEISTTQGQQFVIDDDRGEKSPDNANYRRPSITLRDARGQVITMDAVSGNVNITANATVNIVAPVVNVDGARVNLAGGGPPVARVGDQVDPVTHLIISGSPKVGSG